MSNTSVARAVRWVRSQVKGVPAHTLIWTLIACSATFCLLQGLRKRNKGTPLTHNAAVTVNDHTENESDGSTDNLEKSDEQQAVKGEEEAEEEEGEDSEDEVEEGEGEKDTVSDDEEGKEQHEKEDEEEERKEKDDILQKRKFR